MHVQRGPLRPTNARNVEEQKYFQKKLMSSRGTTSGRFLGHPPYRPMSRDCPPTCRRFTTDTGAQKAAPPNYRHLTLVSFVLGWKPWCYCVTIALMSVVTTRKSDVYHVWAMCHLYAQRSQNRILGIIGLSSLFFETSLYFQMAYYKWLYHDFVTDFDSVLWSGTVRAIQDCSLWSMTPTFLVQ
jgi:hypothetical protein